MTRDSAKVAVLRARQLLKDKRYPDALQVCTDELARGADDPQLRLAAAHALLAQGRHEGAKKEAHQVIRLDPSQAEAHRILADVACARGELATACEHLERVLSMVPSDMRSRELLDTLSRPSALPTEGGAPPKIRASSLDRFIDEAQVTQNDDRDKIPELEISESMVEELPVRPGADRTPTPMEVSDSMLVSASAVAKSAIDQMAEKLPEIPNRKDGPPGLRTLHDPPREDSTDVTMPEDQPWQPGSGAMDAGSGIGQKYQGTLRLPGLEDLPEDEDAPTMPLLRPSAPPEPQLRLDPLASKPVSHEPLKRTGPKTPAALDPSAAIGKPTVTTDDEAFDDFDVEPASVPIPKPQPQPIPDDAPDPIRAMAARGDMTEDSFPGEDVSSPGGELMEMFAGGGGGGGGGRRPPSGDPSFPKRERAPSRRPPPQMVDEDDGWDPEADMDDEPMGEFDMSPPADAGDPFESELAAAGMPKTRRRSKKGLWIFLSVVVVVGGVGGFLYYRHLKAIAAEWDKVRAGIHLSTPAGFKIVEEASKRILEMRSSSAKAKAALGFHAAALAIEFGEDRLKQAKEFLEQTKGADSEWRTAAQGYLSLIDDPARASGYLAKGTEVFPDSAVLKYLRARALAASGDLEAAGEAYQAALKLRPNYLAARVQLAALIGVSEGGYNQAASQLDEILRDHKDNVQALIERARLNARAGKALGQATEDAGRVVGELAENAGRGQIGWAQLVIAQVASRRGDAAALSAALDAAIKAPPCCDSEYRYELAGELLSFYRYADAYTQMSEALSDKGKQASYLHRMARVLLEMDRPKQAAEYLGRAPARHLETRVLNARLAYARGRYAKAESLFKQILVERKDHIEVECFLALTRAKRKRAAEALRQLAALHNRHKDNHFILQLAGLIHFWEGELDAADKKLTESWRKNGLDPRTATYLAWVSMKKHDYARAEKRFNTALRKRPDFAPAHIGLARLKLQTGTPTDARSQAERVSAGDRESADYHALLAQIDLAEGKLDSAQANVTRAEAAGAPVSIVARVAGELALRQGAMKQAVKLLLQARRGDPRNPELLILLGTAQARAKMDDDAFETLKSALKYDDGNPEALLELSKINILDLEYGLAVRDLKKALQQAQKRSRPKSLQAQIYATLGLCYLKKRDTGKAIVNLQDAMTLDPTVAEPHLNMGMTYDALERPQQAVSYYAKSIELDPNLSEAYYRIGKAYLKLQDGANAAKYLQAYLGKNPPSRKRQEVEGLLRSLQ